MENLKTEPDDIAIEFLVGKTELEGRTADFVDAYTLASEAEELTFPAWEPIKRIDFVLLRGFQSVSEYSLLGKTSVPNPSPVEEDKQLWSSDHFGVSCIVGIE